MQAIWVFLCKFNYRVKTSLILLSELSYFMRNKWHVWSLSLCERFINFICWHWCHASVIGFITQMADQSQTSTALSVYIMYNIHNGGLHKVLTLQASGPNVMALLTVSTESALTEAGNSVLTASLFHGLAANFGVCFQTSSWKSFIIVVRNYFFPKSMLLQRGRFSVFYTISSSPMLVTKSDFKLILFWVITKRVPSL